MSRKAICIGICYEEAYPSNPAMVMKSTHSDADRMYRLLTDRFGYQAEDVKLLKDDGSTEKPTRENIINVMHELTSSANADDHFLFYFAGHGHQVEEEGTRTEADGLDEAIWPADVEPRGTDDPFDVNPDSVILDNDIKKILVDNVIAKGAHLIVIFDCCHSGTAADLDEPTYVTHKPRRHPMSLRGISQDDTNVKAVSWAACHDSQVTFGGDRGLFTDALVDVLETVNEGITHNEVLENVRDKMATTLEGFFNDVSPERQEQVRRWVSKNRPDPEVMFLNDDHTLLTSPVEPVF